MLHELHKLLHSNSARLVHGAEAGLLGRPALAAITRDTDRELALSLSEVFDVVRGRHAPSLRRGGAVKSRGATRVHALAVSPVAVESCFPVAPAPLTIGQVVDDYACLREDITAIVAGEQASIEIGDVRALNRCLDNAIAEAVAAFATNSAHDDADRALRASNDRLGALAHDLRNHLHTAGLALAAGHAAVVGRREACDAILGRSLAAMQRLIDRTLSDARGTGGLPVRRSRVGLAGLVADLDTATALDAQSRGCTLSIEAVDRRVAVEVDRDMLFNALANLVQNAFKFTRPGTQVTLRVAEEADRVRIDVADRCGGLQGDPEAMFRAYTQFGTDRSGLGLGLAISRRSIEANGGSLTVRDVPGHGCIFTIGLPRQPSA